MDMHVFHDIYPLHSQTCHIQASAEKIAKVTDSCEEVQERITKK